MSREIWRKKDFIKGWLLNLIRSYILTDISHIVQHKYKVTHFDDVLVKIQMFLN